MSILDLIKKSKSTVVNYINSTPNVPATSYTTTTTTTGTGTWTPNNPIDINATANPFNTTYQFFKYIDEHSKVVGYTYDPVIYLDGHNTIVYCAFNSIKFRLIFKSGIDKGSIEWISELCSMVKDDGKEVGAFQFDLWGTGITAIENTKFLDFSALDIMMVAG